jgi:hypothetical protein
MFFLGAAPSYASCARVAGVAVACNHHASYHRARAEQRYHAYHHDYHRQYSNGYYH